VTQVLGPVNLLLQLSKKAKPFCVHIDKVKPYEAEELPRSWLTDEEQCEGSQGNQAELQSSEVFPVASLGGDNVIAGTVPCADGSTTRPRSHAGRPQRYQD